MLLICELASFDEAHAEFNAALIATARAAFSEDPVYFLAGNKHSFAVRRELARYRISNVRFELIPEPPKGSQIRKHWYIMHTVRAVYRRFQNLECSKLLVCGLYEELHSYFLILMPKWFEGHCCGLIHGGKYLVSRTPTTRLGLLNNGLIRFSTKKKLRVVVLGPTVARFLTENLIYPLVEIKWIYHPYLFEDEPEQQHLNKKPIHFVFLGRTSKGKGFDIFCKLAYEISSVVPAQDAAFSLIGGLRWIPKEYSETGPVQVASTAYRLTRDALSCHLEKASYLVMPHMTAVYGKKKTTGIFLDAVKYLKPIIALKSDDLAHYFEKFGELGFLCESVEEMKQVLLEIIKKPPLQDYSEQQARLLKVREFLNHENQKEAFKALWQD